jgi:hypothetical protein
MIFGSEIVSDAFRWGFRTMLISVPGMPITGSGVMAIIVDRQMTRGVGNHCVFISKARRDGAGWRNV